MNQLNTALIIIFLILLVYSLVRFAMGKQEGLLPNTYQSVANAVNPSIISAMNAPSSLPPMGSEYFVGKVGSGPYKNVTTPDLAQIAWTGV